MSSEITNRPCPWDGAVAKEETLQYVDDQAQRLFGMSSAEAFRQLDEGKFRGTLKKAKLLLLRGLIEGLR